MNRLHHIRYSRLDLGLPGMFMALSLLAIGDANAADSAVGTTSSATGSIFTMLLGLGMVLALLVGLAWLFKRTGLVKGTGSNAVAKIIGGVSVGTRERVMVIEVAEQWIVVGVAPGRVNTLATMPRQELLATSSTPSVPAANFSAWLKQTIEKRNGSSE